jgi:hypothetical protein
LEVYFQVLITNATEEYDGSSWTAGGNLGTARRRIFRSRNSNSWFRSWWKYKVTQEQTEEYDGSTWTAGTTMNTAKRSWFSRMRALQTSALAFW